MSKNLSASEIYQKYYSHVSEENFTKIVSADTVSSNLKRDKLGKYAKWLLNLHKHNCLKIEDLCKATEYITVFDKTAKMNKLADNDLNHYKSLSAMYRTIKPFVKSKSKAERIPEIKENEAERVYEDEAFVVICPRTEAASALYGKGTQWCTASKYSDDFWQYYSQGKLYIVINKHNGRKYQFHAETKSYMDENDEPINIESSKTSVLRKINPTQGLFNYFVAKIPYLYHEFLYEKKYGVSNTEFIDSIDDYNWQWKKYYEYSCHEYNCHEHIYYIGMEDNDHCALYCAKSVGQITGITPVIDKMFFLDKIIPCNDKNGRNEFFVVKDNSIGIYNIDTDSIRWGYTGTVEDNTCWIKHENGFCPF